MGRRIWKSLGVSVLAVSALALESISWAAAGAETSTGAASTIGTQQAPLSYWAVADRPTTGSYRPTTSRGYSPMITRRSAGQYSIELAPATGRPQLVMATAVGRTAVRCGVASQGDARAEVTCVSPTRSRVDAAFALHVTADPANLIATVRRSSATSAPTIDAAHSNNPAGAPLRVWRTGVGRYLVGSDRWPASGLSSVAVASADPANVVCGPAKPDTRTAIEVTCSTPGGTPVDSGFSVLASVRPSEAFASVAGGSVPTVRASTNPSGGSVAVTRLSVGRVRVSFSGVDLRSSAPLVGAAAPGATCQLAVAPTTSSAEVVCFDGQGVAQDRSFWLRAGTTGAQVAPRLAASTSPLTIIELRGDSTNRRSVKGALVLPQIGPSNATTITLSSDLGKVSIPAHTVPGGRSAIALPSRSGRLGGLLVLLPSGARELLFDVDSDGRVELGIGLGPDAYEQWITIAGLAGLDVLDRLLTGQNPLCGSSDANASVAPTAPSLPTNFWSSEGAGNMSVDLLGPCPGSSTGGGPSGSPGSSYAPTAAVATLRGGFVVPRAFESLLGSTLSSSADCSVLGGLKDDPSTPTPTTQPDPKVPGPNSTAYTKAVSHGIKEFIFNGTDGEKDHEAVQFVRAIVSPVWVGPVAVTMYAAEELSHGPASWVWRLPKAVVDIAIGRDPTHDPAFDLDNLGTPPGGAPVGGVRGGSYCTPGWVGEVLAALTGSPQTGGIAPGLVCLDPVVNPAAIIDTTSGGRCGEGSIRPGDSTGTGAGDQPASCRPNVSPASGEAPLSIIRCPQDLPDVGRPIIYCDPRFVDPIVCQPPS